jgi:ribonuclease P protein component
MEPPPSSPNGGLGRFSLTRSSSLKRPADFQRVYKNKQWGNSEHFSFNVMPVALPLGKLGVTVSKKVSKRAVDRNRIKRQIREFYRLRQCGLKPIELVITAKPSCLAANDKERVESLEVLWEKLLKWQRWFDRNQASDGKK